MTTYTVDAEGDRARGPTMQTWQSDIRPIMAPMAAAVSPPTPR
jgi:hypothetical protein